MNSRAIPIPDFIAGKWSLLQPEPPGTKNWDTEIAELEAYFKNTTLPVDPVKLNRYTTITDCSLFIESHLTTVKANNGKRTFLPYLKQLQSFRAVCSKKEKII